MVVSLSQSLASLSSSEDASLSLSLSLSSSRGTLRGTSRTCCAACVCVCVCVCLICSACSARSCSASHARLFSSRTLSSSSGPFSPIELDVDVANGDPALSPFQELFRESRFLFHSGVAPAVVGVPTALGACTVYAVGLDVMVPPSRAMGVRGILPVEGVAGLEGWGECF
jgi:hypothetical protein